MNKNETSDQILPLFLNDDESGFANLLDKYIKSNNNFLPLQAYLDYLETNSLSLFSSISISLPPSIKNLIKISILLNIS